MTRPIGRRIRLRCLVAAAILSSTSCASGAELLSPTTDSGSGEPDRPPATTSTPTTAGSVPDVAEIVVDRDLDYYETEGGRTLRLDVYHPEGRAGLPLVLVFHGNPVFGQTKESVQRLSRAIAEQGAVVVAPTWGSPMAMDMPRIANAIVTWNLEHGPCAAWTALDLADSYGADPGRLIVVGVTTGVLPGQAITFGTPVGDVPGCGAPPVGISVERAILFDTDWFLVPSIWDDVLQADPALLSTSSYWEALSDPSPTQVRMLFGETEAADTVRALDGVSYEESGWIGIRDPDAAFAGDFADLGVLDDGSMSFADVTRVVTGRMVGAGWDAEIVVVPGAGHSLASSTSVDFVAGLVLADP